MNDWGLDNPYQLPASAAKVMPQELGTDFFSSLDKALQLQERNAAENIYGDMESRGLLNSGITTRNVTENVLGPGLQRRQQAFLPFAFESAATGQRQNYEKERQRQEFLNRLEEMREQAYLQRSLMNFQMQLQQQFPKSSEGFGASIGRNFAQSFGNQLGSRSADFGMDLFSSGMSKAGGGGGGGGGGLSPSMLSAFMV